MNQSTAKAPNASTGSGPAPLYTIGIDIGSGAVKTVLFRDQDGKTEWLAKRCERIRRRAPMELARQGYDEVLEEAIRQILGKEASDDEIRSFRNWDQGHRFVVSLGARRQGGAIRWRRRRQNRIDH